MGLSLASLLRPLEEVGLDLDIEAARDAVWLALRWAERGVAANEPVTIEGAGTGESGTVAAEADAARVGARGEAPDEVEAGSIDAQSEVPPAETPQDVGVSTGRERLGVRLPVAPALPGARGLARSIRPLRRRLRSGHAFDIDVTATVVRAAEEDIWLPVLRPRPERWLDLALVVDDSPSMAVWRDVVRELERLLRWSGSFRSIETWWLRDDGGNTPALFATARAAAVGERPRRPISLTTQPQRGLVLVLSDCVADHWYDGRLVAALAQWSRLAPVAIVQTLPRRLWGRTALRLARPVQLKAPVIAATNAHLLGVEPLAWLDDEDAARATSFAAPVVTLEPRPLNQLARLISGPAPEAVPGVVFDIAALRDAGPPPPPRDMTADERVRRFWSMASSSARRLASAFAASPILSLFVLRLLRRELMPEASHLCEAEVLLGGILRRVERKVDDRVNRDGDIPLAFHPGVRPLLLDNVATDDALRVLRRAAELAQHEQPDARLFLAALEQPGAMTTALGAEEGSFAHGVSELLAWLGGPYSRIVERVPSAQAAEEPSAAGSTAQAKSEPEEQGASARDTGKDIVAEILAALDRGESAERVSALASEALRTAERLDPDGAVRLLTGTGVRLYRMVGPEAAQHAFGLAVERANSIADETARAAAFVEIATAQSVLGDQPGATRLLESAFQLRISNNDMAAAAETMQALAAVATRHADHELAIKRLEEAARLYERAGDARGRASALADRARAALDSRDPALVQLVPHFLTETVYAFRSADALAEARATDTAIRLLERRGLDSDPLEVVLLGHSRDRTWPERFVENFRLFTDFRVARVTPLVRGEVEGENWRPGTAEILERADVIVLLVSQNLVDQPWLSLTAVNLADNRGDVLFPVLVEPTDWEPDGWREAIPIRDEVPIRALPEEERRRAIADLARLIVERAAENAERRGQTTEQPVEPFVHLNLIETTGDPERVARELNALHRAWEARRARNGKDWLVVVSGPSGAGKTTLLNLWLERLRSESYAGARCVIGWSFYTQADRDDPRDGVARFLTRTLTLLGVEPRAESVLDLAHDLARELMRRESILLLDGLEALGGSVTPGPDVKGSVQSGRARSFPRDGDLVVPQPLVELLQQLSLASGSLTVLTTTVWNGTVVADNRDQIARFPAHEVLHIELPGTAGSFYE